MFQDFTHRASVDPAAPYIGDYVDGTMLFTVDSSDVVASSAVYFQGEAIDRGLVVKVQGLHHLPAGACLSVNAGSVELPTGLTHATLWYYDAVGHVLAVGPLMGNGLGVIQDISDIPPRAVAASIVFRGMTIVAGQIRGVIRESIPYQPLKG